MRRAGWTAWAPHAAVALYAVIVCGYAWHTLIEDFGVPNLAAGTLTVAHALALPAALYWPLAAWWASLALAVAAALAAGLEATRLITAAGTARVLVLTTFDLDEYVYEALRSGASGFLLKSATGRALAEAVRVVADGQALPAPSVTRRLIAHFARTATRPHRPLKADAALTGRETEVLALVAGGLSNAEIGERLIVAEQTVKTHVGRILAKLGLRDRTQAAVYAYETGLVRPGSG
ncbi:response regulator transcription factor [Spirillospora sp. NPDC029432]|uniref:response regulator transcription factor n=1 Tax=Spirillospora sp. NPDC029432 TaxID=3154599 RepID=UPI003452A169